MHALLLAAGRGERMRPLTDTRPKPLLEAGVHRLIDWQIMRLVAGGFSDIVINHAWLGCMIEEHVGDGSALGARVQYSPEAVALETLGGIVKALPLLGASAFAVVSSDIYTTYDYARLAHAARTLDRDFPVYAAHFVLTDNPVYHPQGDMALENTTVRMSGQKLNYGNIGVFHPRLFEGIAVDQKLKLFPWAFQWVEAGRVSGEHFAGTWENVGTPEQLATLQRELSRSP